MTGDEADRYMFRTAPLRNLAVAPAFFHDGAVLTVEAAIRHHLNVEESLSDYDADDVYDPADDVFLATDLTFRRGPYPPMLARLDEALKDGIDLTEREISDLVEFVEVALTDAECVDPEVLCDLVPPSTPGNEDMEHFFACAALKKDDAGLE